MPEGNDGITVVVFRKEARSATDMGRLKRLILADLHKHLREGGGGNDDAVADLYNEWHRLPEGTPTDLESVERWAYDLAPARKEGTT